MVYEIGDDDVLEVLDVRSWRRVYAVETAMIAAPPITVRTLEFEDDEVTVVRPPAVHLLTGEPILGE